MNPEHETEKKSNPEPSSTPAIPAAELSNEPSAVTEPQKPITPPLGSEPPSASPPPSPAGPPRASQKRSILKFALLVIVILVIIGAAAFAALKISSDNNTKTANPTAADAKKDIASLTIGQLDTPLNVFYPSIQVVDSQYAVNAQIFEGLVRYEDQSKLVPALATGWTNPDNSTWIFTLRKGVKFHTGNTMTAKDVVYSLNTAKESEGLGPEFTDTLKDVKALDDYKVQITTNEPDPILLNKLAFLSIIDSQSKKPSDPANGTGPYELNPSTTPSADKVQLTAFDQYHGGHVYVRELTFVTKKDEAELVKGLESGELNIAGDFSNAHPKGLNLARFTESPVADPTVTMITINQVSQGPLQKLEIRQAIAHALNVPNLLKSTDTSASQTGQMITNAIPGYNPEVKPAAYDVAESKKLLKEAGYPNGLTLKFTYADGQATIANAIQQQLKAVGIALQMDSHSDFDSYISTAIGGKTDLAIISYGSDLLDSSDVFTQVLQQSGNYQSTTLDANLTKAAKTIDPVERLSTLQQTSKYLSDNVATIPLYNRTRIWFMDRSYHIKQDMPGAQTGAYFWGVYQ